MTGKEFDFSFDLNWRKGDIGLRGKIAFKDCDDSRSPEIICYQRGDDGRETCYTLAFFEKTREGYDIRTVGNRLFDAMNEYHIDYNSFIDAVRYFHDILDKIICLQKTAEEKW